MMTAEKVSILINYAATVYAEFCNLGVMGNQGGHALGG